jgi:hypothetical protein
MGTIKKINFWLLLSLILVSCAITQRGFTDHNGQYVPKNPRFKLKDKPGMVVFENLDTSNIYKMVKYYIGDELVYPKNYLTNEENYSFKRELQEGIQYIRFFPKGRCLKFTIPVVDVSGANMLNQTDLNPNNTNYNKCYYFSNDGRNIKIETFTLGDGFGTYVILNYILNNAGDTITYSDQYNKIIYDKEIIPSYWRTYEVDW